jgi:hypothetical protein
VADTAEAVRRAQVATASAQRISRIDRVVRDDRIYTNGMIMGPVRSSGVTPVCVHCKAQLHDAQEVQGRQFGPCTWTK